jgi:hypothetical protein
MVPILLEAAQVVGGLQASARMAGPGRERSNVKVWKVLGVAGLAGVTATGIVVARAERARRHYEPDDVRARLRQRHQEALQAGAVQAGALPATEPVGGSGGRPPGRWRRAWGRLGSLGRRRRPA